MEGSRARASAAISAGPIESEKKRKEKRKGSKEWAQETGGQGGVQTKWLMGQVLPAGLAQVGVNMNKDTPAYMRDAGCHPITTVTQCSQNIWKAHALRPPSTALSQAFHPCPTSPLTQPRPDSIISLEQRPSSRLICVQLPRQARERVGRLWARVRRHHAALGVGG